MAVERFSLSDLAAHARIMLGETSASLSKITDARLYELINVGLQRLPVKLQMAARQAKRNLPVTPRMWTTLGATLTVAAGSSTGYLPTDFYRLIGDFYDTTTYRHIPAITQVSQFHRDLRERPPGPTEYITLGGYVTNGADWQMSCRLYPVTPAGVTPAVSLDYCRLPAMMAGSSPATEYPDISPEYQLLPVYEAMLELLRSDDALYDRFAAASMALILEILSDNAD